MMAGKTYKERLKYFYIACPIILLAVYFLAFSKTITLGSELSDLRATDSQKEVIYRNLRGAIQERNALNSHFGSLSEGVSREMVIQEVSEFCQKNHLVLKEILPEESYAHDGLKISNEVITVKGYYNNLLRLLEYLEVNAQVGKLTSVKFEKLKNVENRKIELWAKIYVQNISL